MRRGLVTAALLFLWTLLVLYPNPLMLARATAQSWTPVVDAEAVRDIAATLPDDPAAIEQAVLGDIVPYGVPWEVYGVPWYFPTPAEVLAAGRGDCQGRAVVFASILEAKGIPYELMASFDHIWVQYESKQPNAIENAQVAIAQKDPEADYWFRWPEDWNIQQSWDIERAYFIDPMPGWRLWLLFAGYPVIVLLRRRGLRLARLSATTVTVKPVRAEA